ncbi:hypothetical protein FA95DRAFT_1498625 [Auriscalpium vulgare]|uniref:Uncharacterized protein n=1 Tax=Auriscalpium vulgare TaxID=40419 RepID=A0ACB8RIB9_9AGAM|nr:hypothetical protein FA95DRAFT_1498625 [Auriscalpium vulgare]
MFVSPYALLATARTLFTTQARLFSSSTPLSFPKLKTHSGTKKRWRALASGGFKRAHAGHSHLNVSKRPGRKNRLALNAHSNAAQEPRLKRLMPYS